MNVLLKTSTTVFASILLTACAGIKPFTVEERSKLTPISVAQTTTPDKKFYDISIKSYQIPRYTTGLTERYGLVAMAIDISDAVQQGKFADRYGTILDEIKQKTQNNLDIKVATQLRKDLESIPFFTGKVKDGAPTKIQMTILDHGFTRGGVDKGATSAVDSLPLKYGAIANVTIVDDSGKNLFSPKNITASSNSMGDVPSLIDNDFALLTRMQAEVIQSLSAEAKAQIEIKLGASK